ncbi:hypothetical protein ASP83_19125, partial [Salmonella enterica subsp. enterica serovar Heidelberg]|nr:hypothetical protein [Salmonella enterica subsp. enterica serovar Heidelberg]ECW5335748.1 hypothetical protein [Salmonella enterica subsp. enterica serovar Heidelberg]ECX6071647.1 hypothetical protein [Salmonella enterica subsp. enterica serovar Heidelberg]HAE9780932.1 hypothetical protein [Salmonella enterica subsp. enterica serovar Heidelberg]
LLARHYKIPAVHTLNDKPVLLVVYAGNFKSLNEAFNSIKVFRPKKTHRRLYNRTIHQSQMSEDVVRIGKMICISSDLI